MALPDNDHIVHSDGYRSDKGEPNADRGMREMADEIEADVPSAVVYADRDLDGPYVEVEHDGAHDAIAAIVEDKWGRRIDAVGSNWLVIR
jgi:hypothetical protein